VGWDLIAQIRNLPMLARLRLCIQGGESRTFNLQTRRLNSVNEKGVLSPIIKRRGIPSQSLRAALHNKMEELL
jgi:hypothetical protein